MPDFVLKKFVGCFKNSFLLFQKAVVFIARESKDNRSFLNLWSLNECSTSKRFFNRCSLLIKIVIYFGIATIWSIVSNTVTWNFIQKSWNLKQTFKKFPSLFSLRKKYIQSNCSNKSTGEECFPPPRHVKHRKPSREDAMSILYCIKARYCSQFRFHPFGEQGGERGRLVGRSWWVYPAIVRTIKDATGNYWETPPTPAKNRRRGINWLIVSNKLLSTNSPSLTNTNVCAILGCFERWCAKSDVFPPFFSGSIIPESLHPPWGVGGHDCSLAKILS